MPLKQGQNKDGCYWKYGENGAIYNYKCGDKQASIKAKKKAIAQAVAIGEYAFKKIGFDYDETLTKESIQQKALDYIKAGIGVYIISARNDKQGMESLANKLGIPLSRVYATGSNKAKVEKVKSLGLTKFYDNNNDVIKELPNIGELVQ
jgi:hydroxymethylpyrimidine pyrophosphatase-like HAD family hydrolase